VGNARGGGCDALGRGERKGVEFTPWMLRRIMGLCVISGGRQQPTTNHQTRRMCEGTMSRVRHADWAVSCKLAYSTSLAKVQTPVSTTTTPSLESTGYGGGLKSHHHGSRYRISKPIDEGNADECDSFTTGYENESYRSGISGFLCSFTDSAQSVSIAGILFTLEM
jgi:hypothetical protein